CSGIGAQLMFTDATIMSRNIADLNRAGIVALPIHDSVVIQAKYNSKTLEIMERNLALKTSPKTISPVTNPVTSHVIDKSGLKSPPHLITHLHNGEGCAVGGCSFEQNQMCEIVKEQEVQITVPSLIGLVHLWELNHGSK